MGVITFVVFSSPGQSPGRAITLPPASESASTFTFKFFKSLYFPDHLINLVHVWYDDRYSSKVLFSNKPAHYLKVMDLDIFNVKDFQELIFSKIRWILFIFGMMIDTVPKFYSTIPCSCLWPQGQGHRLKSFIFSKPYDGFCSYLTWW